MCEMQENNKEESEEKNTPLTSHEQTEVEPKEGDYDYSSGLYAVEIPDTLPPLENLKYVDEHGRFKDIKPKTEGDLAFYWRGKIKMLGLILTVCSFGLLIIILSATTKYTDSLWDILVFVIDYIITFVINSFPSGATA